MMEGWETKTLGEICKIYQPKTISKKQLKQNGEYPVFGANGIIGRYDKYNHKIPQVLITCRGATCGHVNVSLPKSWITGNAMVVRPLSDELDLQYLEYFCRGGIDFSTVISGAAQPQITRKSLSPVTISYPPLPEQKRIVAILDEAFAGIEKAVANTEKNLANARELFESYLNSMFSDKDNGWIETRLGDVAKTQYGLSKPMNETGKGFKIFRMGEVQDGRLHDTGSMKFADIDKYEFEKYRLRENDVLFNRTNSFELVGKVGIFKLKGDYCFASYLIRVLPDKKMLLPEFLNYFMCSNIFQTTIKKKASRSINQANINAKILSNEVIRFPQSLKTQASIVGKLDSIRNESEQLQSIYQNKFTALSELKQSLLQKAFSGELTANPGKVLNEAAA